MAVEHIPVLLGAVLDALGDIQGKTIVDCTFGAGGYSRAFLERGANVIAFDRDPNALRYLDDFRKDFPGQFEFMPVAFSNIANLDRTVDAIVFDLGISSMQIDVRERGFSFRADGPLDMRMAQVGMTAAELIEQSSVAELTQILKKYGDVKKAAVLANAMKQALPQTTFELRDLIFNPKDIAPVFQALRIAVNDEMEELETALAAVPDLLVVGGKCICVSFHSLEDRIVKSIFRDWTIVPGDPRLPVVESAPFELIKTALPDVAEIENNPRARSAHLRGVKKIA